MLVTTAGGIEEDFIKCLAPTYLGDFRLPGKDLRQRGLNRIGNLIAPNNNYIKFEEWLMPLLDTMLEEQKSQVRGHRRWRFKRCLESKYQDAMIQCSVNAVGQRSRLAGGGYSVVRLGTVWLDWVLCG